MFKQGQIEGVVFKPLCLLEDQRGWLTEIFRSDELPGEIGPAMAYVSFTRPGVVRGPHEHKQQTDMFAFIGPGDFEFYCWDARTHSATYANRLRCVVGRSNRQSVVVSPGVVHAYKNISAEAAMVVNLPDRLYAGPGRNSPVDEIRHEGRPANPYVLDL